MPKSVETEIKLRLKSPTDGREALRGLGARLVRERHFEDNLLFDDDRGALAASGAILRVRRTPAGGVLTFKGARKVEHGMKSRREVETAVGDADAMQAILEGLGLRPVFRYQKYRETYEWQGQEIVIDETPIGTFLEIEGDHEGIARAATSLGFSPRDYIADSYVALFFAAGGKGDMVFP